MVSWIKDTTGRFDKRPFYTEDELETGCEAVLTTHHDQRGIPLTYPIPTNELVILLETRATIVDLYSDLDLGVEGKTDFRPNGSIIVQIARQLMEDDARELRLRTTLTHELAHIVFHRELFQTNHALTTTCHRARMLNAPTTDWMEWQAGFASTATLMPRQPLANLAQALGLSEPLKASSAHGRQLVGMVTAQFLVSREAAAIRLQRLGYLQEAGT